VQEGGAALVLGAARVERREAEVGDLEEAVGVEEEVLGLEVAVADPLAVAVLDALEELPEVEAGRGLVEPALGDDLVEQLAARDELEDDEDLLLGRCGGGEGLGRGGE
jgi:hypothetical protein